MTDDHSRWLEAAIEQAREGAKEGGIPIGAALVVGDRLLGVGRNQRVQLGSVIRHGETDCLEAAGRHPASTYSQATIYTTLSPCDMCSGAILLYGIPRVVIGENRTFIGAEETLRSQGVEVIDMDSEACVDLMARFIAEYPEIWNEDIGKQSRSCVLPSYVRYDRSPPADSAEFRRFME
jgi:cytosine/creatinine deaminase